VAILNKLNVVSSNSVTQISPLQKFQDINASVGRHPVADGGKSMPAAEQLATIAEARRREVSDALQDIENYIQNITRELNFSVDEELGKIVVTVVDVASGNVIRQIPSEDMVELAKNIDRLKERSGIGLLLEIDA
jgi:flagellar protein FlaG